MGRVAVTRGIRLKNGKDSFRYSSYPILLFHPIQEQNKLSATPCELPGEEFATERIFHILRLAKKMFE